MAVGMAQRFGQRSGVGASHRAAVSYGMPLASRAYGTAMTRPGGGAGTAQVSTATNSKGAVVALNVQTMLSNALAAANAGKAASAVSAVASARTYATTYASALGTTYPAVIAQIDATALQVQQINAVAGQATGPAGYPSPDAPLLDPAIVDELALLEEDTGSSNTGTWIAVGVMVAAVLGAGALALTGSKKRRGNGRRSRRKGRR